MATSVIVTLQVAGLHSWPAAPAPVTFLRDRHRHVFHFRVEWKVTDLDREVEFILAKTKVRQVLEDCWHWRTDVSAFDFGHASCEMIASCIFTEMERNIRNSEHWTNWPLPSAIEVWEDGENGCRMEFP